MPIDYDDLESCVFSISDHFVRYPDEQPASSPPDHPHISCEDELFGGSLGGFSSTCPIMRLLHTETLEFQEFFDSNIPPYAILSHRWGQQEISYQQMRDGKNLSGPGYSKIRECCRVAESRPGLRGFEWVWIDTCCIDKTSSAELSEAINSMFRWYAGAGECYAYLSDVKWVEDENGKPTDSSRVAFQQSAWFTRGWTLQELLAPTNVIFFDRRWKEFRTRSRLCMTISAITGIEEYYLNGSLGLDFASVAMRMSWASKRKTSRLEDMSYCLMGLFDVNMPLLYGEGNKAFIRLQLEIIKKSDDESIFAWTSQEPRSGMLALWPNFFSEAGSVKKRTNSATYVYRERETYAMTNKGLQFRAPRRIRTFQGREVLSIVLNCWRGGHSVFPVVIHLEQSNSTWSRIECSSLELHDFAIAEDSENAERGENLNLYLKKRLAIAKDSEKAEMEEDKITIYVKQPGL